MKQKLLVVGLSFVAYGWLLYRFAWSRPLPVRIVAALIWAGMTALLAVFVFGDRGLGSTAVFLFGIVALLSVSLASAIWPRMMTRVVYRACLVPEAMPAEWFQRMLGVFGVVLAVVLAGSFFKSC